VNAKGMTMFEPGWPVAAESNPRTISISG